MQIAPLPIANESSTPNPEGNDVKTGDPIAEISAVISGSYVAQLSQLSVLEFSGADATPFLQGQLSCDVELAARNGVSTYGSYCTPKGRMLASFLLIPSAAGWYMVLSSSIAASIQKRLGMFVLRSKVKIISGAQTYSLIGVGGSDAVTRLGEWFTEVPLEPHQVSTGKTTEDPELTIICLPGQRWLLISPTASTNNIFRAISTSLKTVGVAAWELTDIRKGIPLITAKTQEQFIPQMASLELIGGVSFKKGCYPGQEIVARTQYLGKLKRRLYLAHVDDDAMAGDELHSDDVQGQSNGMVVNAAPAPGGGCDVLAVVQEDSAIHSRVHLRSANGALLQFLPLSYPVS